MIKDHAHTSELNASFQEAFSLRYKRDYPAAARAFETGLKDNTIGQSTQIDVLNQLGFIYLEMSDTTAAIPLLDKLAKLESDFNSFQRADYWYNLGVLNLQRIKPDEAKKNLEDALRMYEAKYPRGHLRIALTNTKLALHQVDFGLKAPEVNNSIRTAFSSFYFANDQDSTLFPYAEEVNYLMAQYYRMVPRDYGAGLNHCQLVEKLIARAPWKDTALLARSLGVKGLFLKKKGRYHEADSTIKKGLQLLQKQGKNSIFIQEMYRFLMANAAGRANVDTETKAQGEKLYFFYLTEFRAHQKSTNQSEIYIQTDELYAYYCFYRLDEKKQDCLEATELFLKKIKRDMPIYRYYNEEAYNFLTSLEIKNKNYDKALTHQLTSFKTEIDAVKAGKINNWSDAIKPANANLRVNPFFAFSGAGKIYLAKFNKENKVEDLAFALKLFEIADDMMSLGLTMNEEGVLSYHQEMGDDIYTVALEAAHLAYTLSDRHPDVLVKEKILDLAFRFIERQKSYILFREDLFFDPNTQYFISKIKEVATDITTLREDSTNMNSILSLVKANFEYDRLLNKLFKRSIENFKQKIPKVTEIRSRLKKDEVLVQYKVFKDQVYVLSIGKKQVYFDTVGHIAKLQKYVAQFEKLVSSENQHQFNYAGLDSARVVYDLLIKPIEKTFPSKNAVLIVIPDRFLTDLPFDALPIQLDTTVKDWRNVKYLLLKHYVVYAPSWKIWQQNRYARVSSSAYRAAFFSYTTKEGQIPALALEGAKAEKDALADFAQVKVFKNGTCTAAKFRQCAYRFKILHFCLHGESNPLKLDANQIFFQINNDQKIDPLSGSQISNLDLRGKWAIISACETGIGQTNSEGTYSLSRAFLQAGCAFTISSLWEINDKSTTDILVNFYKQLEPNDCPWIELAKAKRQFVEMHNYPPYNWSGLIPTI
ncbi:CHAT domain-containing protein [Haliscomenobacter hydrossis]|uniref:CHAT domain-containing protein n=1 Tax=Haliscomenobacter hydrossis TaxID=2350 RepID=UPI00145D3F70|nr:CHAT domain-containing tetratricopeptide repeat protein [Haliscomenobacter hydrossis]